MQEPGWEGSGPEFTLSRGDRRWTLKVDQPRPGLCLEGERLPKLLSLDHLARPGRSDFEAFTAGALVEFERHRSAVRATFAPPSWGGLLVRASWSAANLEAVDLEIQLSASSVGELEGLEVAVVTRFPIAAGEESGAPALSGPEPPGKSLWRCPWGPDDLFYAEMVHPDDVTRRIGAESISRSDATSPSEAVHRHVLFGLALEKGVILRGRLRGCWFQSPDPRAKLVLLYEDFLANPLPLGP